MNRRTIRVLLVEDNPGDTRLVKELFRESTAPRFDVIHAANLEEAFALLADSTLEAVLLDLNLPESQRLATLAEVRLQTALPIVVLTGLDDETLGYEAIRAGAQDYLVKGRVDSHTLVRSVRYAIERKSEEEALRESEWKLREAQRLGRIGNWEFDPRTGQIQWSDVVFEIYERDPKIGPPTAEEEATYYSPEDAERLHNCARSAIEMGQSYEVDVRVKLSGGRFADVVAIGTPVKDVNGRVIRVAGTVQDITRRKQAEEELRESEARYRAIFEASANGILIADLETRVFQYANPAICRMLGYTEEELKGMAVADIHPKESLDHVMAEFGAQVRGEKSLAESLPCLRKDGSVIYADVTATPVVIDNRACNVGFFMDISERKRAEAALRQSEKRFRILFEQAADCIFLLEITPEGIPVIRDANSAAFKLLGFEREELIGRPVSFIDAAPDADKLVETRRQKVLSGTGKIFEARHRCKDGTIRDFECSVNEIQLGSKTFAISVERDITEHRQAEEALKASEEKYRTLFESSRDAIMTLAPPSWRFTTGNPAMIKMFGARDKADFVSRAPWEYSPEKQPDGRPSKEKALEMIETAMAKGSHFFEWTHQRLGGDTFPATVLLTRVEISGQALLQATVHDITEIKRAEEEREKLEEQFRQAQKMEAVGRLAGGVAHDFNNLLTIITGYCEIMLGSIDEQNPFWKKVNAIAQAGERAAQLTRQLLTFSRKQILKPKTISLNAVVNESKKLLSRLIGENIELRTVLAPELQPVLADPGQVEQVIMNLAVNARDAMPDGGDLSITTANVELSQDYAREHSEVKPGLYVMLAISDTGTGMSEEVKKHLFEPFFTTKEQGKGTGLGLSTVYGIVKQSNGHIGVYTELGHGTTFKVYFPVVLDMTEGVQAEGQKVTKPVKGSETILVVEDESGVREFMVDVLRSAGYGVLTADSGEKAEKVCAAHQGPIHLLLTDMMLPRIGGREVARKLALTYPDAKVLFMSGYTDDVIFRSGGLDPGMAFLEKPFTPDVLLHKVREVLGGGA